MKYSLLAIVFVAQIFGSSMAYAIGETATIAKFAKYPDLTVTLANKARYTFYTPEIQRLYALRGSRAVWFAGTRSNGKIGALLGYMRDAYDTPDEVARTWSPVLSRLNQVITNENWIGVEMVATHTVLLYLNAHDVWDYSALNRALAGNAADLIRYLKSVSDQYNNQYFDNGDNGGGLNSGELDNDYGNQNGGRIRVTIPPVVINPLPPVVQPAPVNTTFQVAPEAIGTSVARYANDPTDADVNKLYSFYNQAIWIDYNRSPNDMAVALKDTLRSANRHGLNPNDYWDTNLESLYQNARYNSDAFELAATRALLRYVNHLSGGRLDPKMVDAKLLKFELKRFTDVEFLSIALQGGAANLKSSLDMLAPQLPQYKQLMSSLARISTIKQQGTWKKIGDPGVALQLGATNSTVSSLRTQLAQLGYANTGSGNVYDADLDQAVKAYIEKNGLQKMDYRFWNSLYKTADEQMLQIAVNMEKLRWIPAVSATRYAFVNLAAQEIRLMDQGAITMKFKTVNGSAERSTPSMLQQAKRVILNPTWTTPVSLAIKDKIPAIKQDPTYMLKHNMYILDTRSGKYLLNPLTGQPVTDLSTVDMTGFTDNIATNRYYFVQGPGNQNALGVLKFPLQNMDGTMNSDDIYMHDTNERALFNETMRYRSSGCIRLQFPLEFAAEMLKDAPKPLTVDGIKALTPWDNPDQVVTPEQTNQPVSFAKPLIVYIMYLTSEQNEDGSIRMFEDTYGIDAKIVEALKSSI